METLRKAEVIVFLAICVIGGGILVSAGSIPKYWTQLGHWTGDSQATANIKIGPFDLKNGTTYHIAMTFTPRHLAEDQSNKTYFYLETTSYVKVTAVYDWSADLAQATAKVSKEYTITVGKAMIEDVVLWVMPYYGAYDIVIEYLSAVIDAASITA
jgi:hypothetical protein